MTKEQIKIEAKEFCTKFEITSGWTQEQHVGFVKRELCDSLGIERKEDMDEMLTILALTCNPSAFRQTLETAEILAKSDKGVKASVLANKYA